jgi:hypothetical protein
VTNKNMQRCPACDGILSSPKGVTYLAQRQDWVKIGRTSGPVSRRIKALSRQFAGIIVPAEMDTSQPLTLLGTIAFDVEHKLHVQFAEWHVAGEWFHAAPILRWLVAA